MIEQNKITRKEALKLSKDILLNAEKERIDQTSNPQPNKYIPFPDKKYKVILCDPPWSYNDKALAGKRGAGCKYEVQDLEWIKNLPVATIADDDCALFIWVTMPHLPIVWEVLKSWGFKYKSNAFTWIKKNKKADSLFWGMGTGTRANAELCLLATKGKPKRVSAAVHSVVMSPIQKHSQKPDEVRKRIVDLYGDVPRIELFARDAANGFDRWGLEAPEMEKEVITEETAVIENSVVSLPVLEHNTRIGPAMSIDQIVHHAVYGPGKDNYGRDDNSIAGLMKRLEELHKDAKEKQEADTTVGDWRTIHDVLDVDTNEPIEVRNNANGTLDIKSGYNIFSGCYPESVIFPEFKTIDGEDPACSRINKDMSYTYKIHWCVKEGEENEIA